MGRAVGCFVEFAARTRNPKDYLVGSCNWGTVGAAIVLAIAPPGSLWWRFADKANGGNFNEEIGWPELVETIASVRDSLPVEQQSRLGVLAGVRPGRRNQIVRPCAEVAEGNLRDELSLVSRVWRSVSRDGDRSQAWTVLRAKEKCQYNEQNHYGIDVSRAPELPNDQRMPSVQDNSLQRLIESAEQNQQDSYGC
jgi:hypothetical protein